MTFDPNEARDRTGKWTAGGADGSQLEQSADPFKLTTEQVRERADKIAKDMGFDPARIDISDEAPTFMLNGRSYNTGGIAETNKPEGEGRIVLYRPNLNQYALDGTIIHEIEHMKFQTVLNRYQAENTAIGKEPGPAPDPSHKYFWGRNGGIDAVMAPSGGLRGDYAAKYPVYSALQETFHKYGAQEFAKTDGVSNYSFDWWDAYQDGKTGSYQAVHETLAEMARIKRMTGAFPEHMGPRVLAYRAKLSKVDAVDAPKMSKSEIEKGTKMWRELYRTVERLSK